jgi:cytochrome b561
MTDTARPAPQQRYTAVAIALHWSIAALIIGMILLGWTMTSMREGADQFALFQLHKSIGVTILLLTVARIAWRLMNPPPPEPPMPGWQRMLALVVHVGFYVMLVVMPLTGWIMVSADPSGIATRLFQTVPWPHLPGLADLPFDTKQSLDEPLRSLHANLAWVIIVLLALHVAGALKHQFVDKDGLIARMAPGLAGRTSGPPDHGHGALWAFGASALLFAVVAGSSLIGGAPAATASGPEQAGPEQASPAPFWSVDPAQSSIRFRSAYMGRAFEGNFRQWTATIQFDPGSPQDARIRVVVPTASITTNEPYFDENVTQGDWFDVTRFPEAVFEVNEGVFKDSETQYEATGVLTVKGVRHPVRLPFTLDIQGDTARMHGETTLLRIDLGLGRDTRATANGDEEWVQNQVAVVVDVVATRQ